MNPPAPTRRSSPSRHLLFARTREALAAAATRAVLEALPAIASQMAQLGLRETAQPVGRALGDAAEILERDAVGRAARAADGVSQRALHVLESLRLRPEGSGGLDLSTSDGLGPREIAEALAMAIREEFEGTGHRYEEYAQRVGSLVDARWRDDALNPLGAGVLASAAVSAIADVAETEPVRFALRRAACDHLPAPLARAIAEADRILQQAAADESTALAPQPVSSAEARAPTPDGARVSPALHRPIPELRVLAPLGEIEADAVTFAHSRGLMPYTREARSRFFSEARRGLKGSDASAAQLAVLDVVAAMFDYVIDDRQLPEPAKPLVWRLQQPVLALSVLDARYLADEVHSLRRLVEHIGAIAIAFAEDIVRGSELHRRLDSAVSAIERVTSTLLSRADTMARQVDREFSKTAEAVAELVERVARERQALEAAPDRRNRRDYSRRPGPEHERQVTDRIRGLLDQRLSGRRIPESVQDFLNGVWLRYLRTAAMRNGEQSGEFGIAVQVVDDLVWSLDTDARPGRQELASRIPPLIGLITRGLQEIGAREEDFAAFFDELFLIHLRRMRPVPVVVAAATAPVQPAWSAGRPVAGEAAATADIELATLEVAGSGAAQSDGDAADPSLPSVLSSLDLDDLDPHAVRLPLEPSEAIRRLERGTWIDLAEGGSRDGQLKVVWINRRGSLSLLVRRRDRRAISMRIEELARRFERGQAALLGRTPGDSG